MDHNRSFNLGDYGGLTMSRREDDIVEGIAALIVIVWKIAIAVILFHFAAKYW